MSGVGETGEVEERLYGLLEVAERQQAAVQAALDGLAGERAALEGERARLAREVTILDLSLRGAVSVAVKDSLAAAATEGAKAVEAATGPLLGELAAVMEQAGRADAALRRVVLWASWRLLGWIAAVGAATALVGWLTSSGVLWWDARAIAAARAEKAQLQAEVAELKANYDGWVKLGVQQKVIRCNPGNRPCIRVDENAGQFGSGGDAGYRVIWGY